jgi:mannan endo-1,4-beta-mannosidase
MMFKTKSVPLLIASCAALTLSHFTLSHQIEPVNSNANTTTKDLYNWLSHLPYRPNNKVLSGAFGGYTNIGGEDVFSAAESDDIYNATNPSQRPAIYACDYARGWSVSASITDLIDDSCNAQLIAHWQQGGLVQISNHLPNPVAEHKWGEDGGNTPNCSADYTLSINPADSGKQYGLQDTDGLQDSTETNGTKRFVNKCLIQANPSQHQWGLGTNGFPLCSYDYSILFPSDNDDQWGFQDTDTNGIGNSCFISTTELTGFGGGLKAQISDGQFSQILDRTTRAGQRWKAVMDKVAAGLLELQINGVPVIYRPLHEMNGDWFWWGPKDRNSVSQVRKDLYKSLYQDMYNYFTYTKGLNNLIWVYSPDAGPSSKSAYYPGSRYVDIVGLDAYHDTPALIQGYTEMLLFNKPFAFAEVGPKTLNSNFDYQTFIDALKNNFPQSIYFIPWNAEWSPLNNSNISGLFNDSWTLNRSEIYNDGALTAVTENTSTLFDFESGTQNWIGENVSAGPWSTTDWATTGAKSLKADLALSAQGQYQLKLQPQQNINLQGKQSVLMDVKLASWGNVGNGISAKFYIKTGNAWTWKDSVATLLNNDQQASLNIDLSGVADLDQVKEMGLFLSLDSGSGQTAIYVDNVRTN